MLSRKIYQDEGGKGRVGKKEGGIKVEERKRKGRERETDKERQR